MNYKHSTVLRLMSNAMLFTFLISSLFITACEPEGYIVELNDTGDPPGGCTQLKVYFRDEVQVLKSDSCMSPDLWGECVFVITDKDTMSIISNFVGDGYFEKDGIIAEEESKFHYNMWYQDKYRKDLNFNQDSVYFDFYKGNYYTISQLYVRPNPKEIVVFHVITCYRLMFVIKGELNNHSFEQAKELITAIKVK